MRNDIGWIHYRYHPVGQGLFTSAALTNRSGSTEFRWVYDCGTTSKEVQLPVQIAKVAGLQSPRGKIDLVVISHFDKDHISGLADLLASFRIGTLMLPYAPLASRLVLAFQQGVSTSDPVFRLFVDPLGYILALDGAGGIDRIILVPPSDGDTSPPLPDDEDGPERPEGGERGSFELLDDADRMDSETAADLMATMDGGAEIFVLRPGGRLWLDALWEFVPYNNAEREPADLATFRTEVASRRQALLAAAKAWRNRSGPEKDIAAAIDELKKYYDKEIGADPKSRNLISLFLYSGPLFKLTDDQPQHHHYIERSEEAAHYLRLGQGRIAQLFSGDGYLNSSKRMDDLEKYLTKRRLDRVGIFQVMHHGAKANWYQGVAARLAPKVSLFSSDPARGNTYHPHAEVLRDFWPFSPVQIDLTNTLDVEIRFY